MRHELQAWNPTGNPHAAVDSGVMVSLLLLQGRE
jgi:hypothetical protein